MAESEELPEGGPGLKAPPGLDRIAVTAAVFALLCLVPTAWIRSTFQAHAFGPLQFGVILAMVAVLFGFLAIMRSTDTKVLLTQRIGIAAVAIGLIRTLLYPLLGW